MNKSKIHKCQYQSAGIIIEYSPSYSHNHFTWQLVITREATELDIENNHILEQVGDTIWNTFVEINNCPYCGENLRNTALETIEFTHFDFSSWSAVIS